MLADLGRFAPWVNDRAEPDQFHLKVVSETDENLQIKIFDVLGQLIQKKVNVTFDNDITFGSDLAKGVYLLEVSQGLSTKVMRIGKSE